MDDDREWKILAGFFDPKWLRQLRAGVSVPRYSLLGTLEVQLNLSDITICCRLTGTKDWRTYFCPNRHSLHWDSVTEMLLAVILCHDHLVTYLQHYPDTPCVSL